MDWLALDFIWPVLGSILAGALIGAEREYRGSPAGVRTHILVSLTSGLLMLAAVHQVRWLTDTPEEMIRIDPVRMAHGILTGIGFLGAGVIFRDGFTIRGLTTAGSLWITSALGTLFGVGFYGLAIGGTIATLAVLAAVSVSEALSPQSRYAEITVRYRRSAGVTETAFRQLLSDHGLSASAVCHSLDDGVAAFSSSVRGAAGAKSEALAADLMGDEQVVGFEILPKVS